MEFGKHLILGDSTGRVEQEPGKHRDGVGFIPHGDRNRCKAESEFTGLEERDSDPNIRRI